MADKLLFNFTTDNTYTGTNKLVWTMSKSALDLPAELLEADKYYFTLNGVEYTCDDVYEGSSKYFFNYKVDGLDAIGIQYFKNEDKLELVIRKSNFPDFEVGQVVEFYEIHEDPPIPPTSEGIRRAYIRFDNEMTAEVIYDVDNDTIEVRKLED